MWLIAAILTFLTPEVRIQGTAQGTTYHIRYLDEGRRNFRIQVDSILSDIDRALSAYRTDSEISIFNAFDDFRFRSGHFYPVLQRAYEIWQATGGAFDPTVAPLTEAYRKGKKSGRSWQPQIDSLLQYVGFRYIAFDTSTVHKTKTGVRLDLDAIAQGYTVDVICAYLEKQGIADYLVELGGELRCGGAKQWPVSIDHPLDPAHALRTIAIRQRAMATSGSYNNHYSEGGQTFSHIINPKTGILRPDPLLSATVLAEDAMTADAYATALMVLGLEDAKRLLSKHKELGALLVYSNGHGEFNIFTTGIE